MVLIIAEDGIAREVYAELFALRGYEVVTASDGRSALRLARTQRLTVAVLALSTGAAALQRKLRALRPTLRIHAAGRLPRELDGAPRLARQRLH